MDLISFNEKLLTENIGFKNLGATCYFNSMLQSLLSCTSLTRIMLENQNNDKYKNNIVSLTYINGLLGKIEKTNFGIELWQSIIQYLSKKNIHKYFGHGQEDTHESFKLLLECWEELTDIIKLFTHKDNISIYCTECKQWNTSLTETMQYYEITREFKSELPIHLKKIIKEEDQELGSIENYITRQITYIDSGYKCRFCSGIKQKIKIVTMILIPEILVLVCPTKVIMKYEEYFPNTLEFNSTIGKIQYIPVSQIIHAGNAQGGHYWSNSIRKNGWYELNDMQTNKINGFDNKNSGSYVIFYHKY